MNPSELFDLWAPPTAQWSPWAKPVLFAEAGAVPALDLNADPLPALPQLANRQTAVVVDLPSAESVRAGLALAVTGHRPVPLFNGARGPRLVNPAAAVVDNDPILAWLSAGAELLVQRRLPYDAPPAFLLDARRKPAGIHPGPGRFDNRWIVFPQDFPSANFLRTHSIAQVLVLQSDMQRQPHEDLAHVLLRWQEAGLPLLVASPDAPAPPHPLRVMRPSRFRSLWYCALAVMGLRRSSAGGFGSVVPQPSSSAG